MDNGGRRTADFEGEDYPPPPRVQLIKDERQVPSTNCRCVELPANREQYLGQYNHVSKYAIGDFVNMDGCARTKAVVVGITIRPGAFIYQVSYFDHGTTRDPYIEEFRLSLAED